MKEMKAENLSLTYGEKVLFDSISLSISEKDRIGLIGNNGTGKTHLMNILAGEIKPESGKVGCPKEYTISYLKQFPDLNKEDTVLEAVFAGSNPIMNTVRNYEEALERLKINGQSTAYQEQFTAAEEEMNRQSAWTADAQAKSILTSLGIVDLQAKVKELSGGQAKRVGLAQVLIQEPDLLLLDEPTNHLDFNTIQWLEQYLSRYKGALLMVTHDRYFLERVVNQIVELSDAKLQFYEGNYETYLSEKAEMEETEAKKEHKKAQLYKQELAWMRKGAKARSTKQEARKQRFETLKDSLKKEDKQGDLEVNLPSTHIGKKVIEMIDGSISWKNNKILDQFSLLVQNRDRIGITGENGAGKTTFLDILAGNPPLDEGELLIGETVRMAYYRQQSEGLDEEKRVIQFMQEIAEEVETSDGSTISVSQLLEKFLFPKHTHGTLISRLSGGEKRRLYLLSLLMRQPNVLLLDEPTNDLDLATLTVLEEYIETFPGAVISVSHDRYFLDKTSDILLVFKGNAEIEKYWGSLSDYQQTQDTQTQQANPKNEEKKLPDITEPNRQKEKKKEKHKLTYMEQKEWETIEEELFALEEKIDQFQTEMESNGSDSEKLSELEAQRRSVQTQFDEKMNRWEYLSQYAE